MGRPSIKSQGLHKKARSPAEKQEEILKRQNQYTVPNINEEVVDIQDIEDRKKVFTYKCTVCGESTNDIEDRMFPDSFSNLYAGWAYHLPICKKCIDKLYDTYTIKHHMTEEEAVRRICMNYDIYYNQSLVDIMKKASKPNARMSFYIAKSGLLQYANKTYANTLEEERKKAEKEAANQVVSDNSKVKGVKEKDYKFWGFGFTPEEMDFLNDKYEAWTASCECSGHNQVTIFKQMSMLELQILKNMQNGQPTAPLQKQLNEFMNSANLQPKQNTDNTFAETNTFGTLIKKLENEKPVSKPAPEWEDVDKIGYYISVWFLGHLCKMIGINNKFGQKWTRLYEEEVEKFTAHPPTYFDNDGEAPSFDEVFNK